MPRKENHISESRDDDDQTLVGKAQRGDRTAFDRLMLRHQENIALQMRRFSTNVEVMAELTQTVFVKAYMNLGKYRGQAPFLHWLRVIASRTGYEYWRTEYRNDKTIPFEEYKHGKVADPKIGDDASRKRDAGRILARVMARLKQDEQQTLYMLYIDGMSVAEVAACMGWSQAMTKMRSFRARRKLRKTLHAEGIGPEWFG